MNNKKTYLIEKYMSDINEILRVLTMSNQQQGNKADPNYTQYKALADWATKKHVQTQTKEILLDTMELSDRSLISSRQLDNRYATLGHLLNKLVALMKDKAKYDPKNPITQKVQQTTLEILTYLKDGPKEENSKLYQGMDWTAEKASRLKNANGRATSEILDEFYNDYYKIEYAGLKSPEENDSSGVVDKLKSLDKILIQEFNKLGYNPDVNPLAQFLKILIGLKKEGKSNIFNKLNTNNYGAIHNSFIDKYITGNTLGNYNENHILFCEDLYNYKGLDMVKYLKLYKDTLDKAKSVEVEPPQDMWTLAAKIFILQDLSSPDAPSKAQFNDKVTALIQKQDGLKTPVANNAKLRSLAEIEELYTYIFKAAPDNEKQEENETLKLIVDYAKKKDIILDMLYEISQRDTFRRAYPKDASTVEQQLTELDYKSDGRGIKESKKVLSLAEEQLTTKDWYTLVKKLFNAYKPRNKRADK